MAVGWNTYNTYRRIASGWGGGGRPDDRSGAGPQGAVMADMERAREIDPALTAAWTLELNIIGRP